MARTRAQRGGRGGRRGRGGRGGADPEGENGNQPDLGTVISQTITALMPTLVAQVTAAMGGNENNGNGNNGDGGDNGGGNGTDGNGENGEGPVIVEPVNREVNRGHRQGCTYKDFKNYGPPEFDGRGGATAYIQWI